MSSLLIFVIAIVGFLSCFFGLKMRKLVFAVAFFAFGFSLARYLAPVIDNGSLLLTLRIVAGFICALISFSIEKIVIFLYMFLTGFQFVQAFCNIEIWYYLLLAIVVGLILAFLSLKLFKLLIILSTAMSGALILATITVSYLPVFEPYEFIVTLVFTALGTIFQFSNNRNMTMNGRTSLY